MKKISKILSIILVAIIMMQTSLTAFATSKTSSIFNSNTYTHQTKYDDYKITQGVDLSYYNGDVDFAKIKKAGVDFVILRVGYRGYGTTGTLCYDSKFSTYIKDAKNAGLKVGVYFYSQATSTSEAKEEANYVLDKLGSYKLELPIVWDIEFAEGSSGFIGRLYNANLTKTQMTNNAIAFCDTVKNAGFDAMVYASKSFFEDYLNTTTLENKGYGIWLAHYVTNTTYSGNYQIWQYSDKGTINGISGNVDCNFMYTKSTSDNDVEFVSLQFEVSKVSNKTYTGSAIKPSFTVTYDGKELIKGEDYTVTYKNNTQIGTAQIVIKGFADYEDFADKTIEFKILPAKVKNVSFTSRSTNSIKIKWDKFNYVDGYQVQVYKNSAWSTVSTVSTNSCEIKNLSSAANYKFRVRAYKKVNSTNYYGSYSDEFTQTTTPAKITGISTSSSSATTVTLSWTKQSGATKYRVYKYNTSTKKYEKYKDVTTNSCKISSLSANASYKFKVRAYKTSADGETLSGESSDAYTAYTKPKTPKIKSATSSSTKKIKATWSTVSGVTGYQVMWSTTKNFSSNYKSEYVSGNSTASKTVTTAQSKKQYYVRVRSYKTRNGTKIYSAWSDTLSVKTK